jgi:hypothetical protein
MEQAFERHMRRTELLLAFWLLPATTLASGPSNTIAHLPNVQINAAKVDASGKIYLAGQTTTAAGSIAAYISKLSPDGTTTYYAVTLGGSGTTAATAVDIDSAGAVYVTGTTTGNDFPVSPGAARSTGATAFAAKLDARGNVVYSALIGGSANTSPNSIVVNTRGELVVSGRTTTAASPPATPTPFLLKLSADAATVVPGPQGIGGLLATDSQNNVYVAGDAVSGSGTPSPTSGAFQGSPALPSAVARFSGSNAPLPPTNS